MIQDSLWTRAAIAALIVGTMPTPTTFAAAAPSLVATIIVFNYQGEATPGIQTGTYARNSNGDEVVILNDARGKPATTCLTDQAGTVCAYHAQKLYRRSNGAKSGFGYDPALELMLNRPDVIQENVNEVVCWVDTTSDGRLRTFYSPEYKVVMRRDISLTINEQARRSVQELNHPQLVEPAPQLFMLDLTGYSASPLPGGGGGGFYQRVVPPTAEGGGGVYKAGGGVTAPELISKTEPEYTAEARAANLQGTVVLYAEVTPAGDVINPRVIRSLSLGLDEKAIESVRQWKFKPGLKGGQPVTVAATLQVGFDLSRTGGGGRDPH
jgi:TonB family protein